MVAALKSPRYQNECTLKLSGAKKPQAEQKIKKEKSDSVR